jgi:hypothetical protein
MAIPHQEAGSHMEYKPTRHRHNFWSPDHSKCDMQVRVAMYENARSHTVKNNARLTQLEIKNVSPRQNADIEINAHVF